MSPHVATVALRTATCACLLVCAGCDHASSTSAVHLAPAVRSEPALPTSNSTTAAPSDAQLVVLSRRGLQMGSDGPTLATPDIETAAWAQGFEAKYKRGSRRDWYLVPLGAALRAPRRNETSAVVIAADPSVSYRMLTEVVYTLGAEHVRAAYLLVRSGASEAAIALTLPSATDVSAPPTRPTLSFTVIVTGAGFVASAAGRQIGNGCHGSGTGAAVPKRGDGYDFSALTACATAIKSSDPRLASETRVMIMEDFGIDVQTLVWTMDAVRGSDGALFPDVALGVPM